MIGNVWAHQDPIAMPDTIRILPAVEIYTPVEILAFYGRWVKISWYLEDGFREGWVPAIWVSLPLTYPRK